MLGGCTKIRKGTKEKLQRKDKMKHKISFGRQNRRAKKKDIKFQAQNLCS